jgi:hypothetical protein
VRGLHAGLAFAPGHVLFAGLGGEVSDDPQVCLGGRVARPRNPACAQASLCQRPKHRAYALVARAAQIPQERQCVAMAVPVGRSGGSASPPRFPAAPCER